MSDAGQDEEQAELADSLLAESARDAEIGGYLFEGVKEAEDRAAEWIGSDGQIEFVLEQEAESGDTGNRPGGEIGEGAVLDFTILAEGFPEENGWGRVAIGDLRDVHNCIIQLVLTINNRIIHVT